MSVLPALALLAAVPLPRTVQLEMTATASGARHQIAIALPRSFDHSTKRYPVLVLLDAGYAFPLAHAIVNHLVDRDRLPELIVVGVGYPDGDDREIYKRSRTRDYTPWHVAEGGYGPEYQRLSGGAAAFAQFLERELFPMLEAKYRATADRTLVGHSYGGLFAAWLLANGRASFGRFIIVSPSLWYAGRRIFSDPIAPQRAQVYLAVGARESDGEHDIPRDLRRFHEQIRPSTDAQLEIWPEQNHDTVFPFALSNGLRFVWTKEGWGRR